MAQKYWRGPVHTRALQETRELLHIETGDHLVIGIGILVIALAYVWLSGEHETARSEIIVRVVFTAVILLAFPFIYIYKFITVPGKLHCELEQENARLKSDKAVLEVRSGNIAPYYWTRPGLGEYYFRIGIFNAGPKVAENVQVTLHEATKPRCLSRDNFPYRVVRAGTEWGTGAGLRSILIEDVRINPLNGELFDVAHYWYNSENKLFIDKIDTKTNGQYYSLNIEPDERWELQYETTAANASAVRFRLAIDIREGALNIEKIA